MIKLRHLESIAKEQIKILKLISEIKGYRWRITSFLYLLFFSKSLQKELERLRGKEPQRVEFRTSKNIISPKNIDLIPFSAMLELVSLLDNRSDLSVSQFMARVISITCYSENFKDDFDTSSDNFKAYVEVILDSDLEEMLGLFNWIESSVEKSQEMWRERFDEVEVVDKDYEQAESGRMSKFSVIQTIKSVCLDFNIGYKEALQVPYGMTQASSLARATTTNIQYLMTQSAEERMRRQRQS